MNVHTWKTIVQNALNDPYTAYFVPVNRLLTITTLVSLGVFAVDATIGFEPYTKPFFIIEWITILIFSIEYILRVWSAQSRIRYVLSLMGIIDLVSILPSFLGLGDFTILKTARLIRTMRFLRILGFGGVTRVLPKKKKETKG